MIDWHPADSTFVLQVCWQTHPQWHAFVDSLANCEHTMHTSARQRVSGCERHAHATDSHLSAGTSAARQASANLCLFRRSARQRSVGNACPRQYSHIVGADPGSDAPSRQKESDKERSIRCLVWLVRRCIRSPPVIATWAPRGLPRGAQVAIHVAPTWIANFNELISACIDVIGPWTKHVSRACFTDTLRTLSFSNTIYRHPIWALTLLLPQPGSGP